MEGLINLGATWSDAVFANSQTVGGSGKYTDCPTITYTPLTGEKFARSIMTPIPVSAILSLEDSNKIVEFDSGGAVIRAKISGSRTAITIDGADADRKALSVGMTCEFKYDSADDKNEPSMMVCTN